MPSVLTSMKSKEVRDLALSHLNDGKTTKEVACFLKVSQRTIRNWKKAGPIIGERKLDRVSRRCLTPIQEEGVLAMIQECPGILLDDIVEFVAQRYCVTASRFAISRLMKRNSITRKRGTRMNIKYDVQRGLDYLAEIKSVYSESFASLDEMSVMLNIAPTYGYAVRGQRAVIRQPGRRTVSYMLTLCVGPQGIISWELQKGAVTADTFCNVLRKLPDGITLLLDNARIHHASKCLISRGLPTVAELASGKSISLRYIPPYAPHLNPVEYTFNTVRNLLRQKEAWTLSALERELEKLFQADSFSPESMTKLFKSVIFGGAEAGQRLVL